MLPITVLLSIYDLYIVACVYSLPTEPINCSCLLTEDLSNNSETYGQKVLHCERDDQHESLITHSVPCLQYKNLVRIGPVPGDLDFRNHVTIAPWGFGDLLTQGSGTTFQLDLQLEHTEVNALSFGGLETIREFLGRHSVLRWDGCSFAHMRQLESVLLSCKSTYDGFLTFGPGIRVVRFVDCEDLAMQFYCITCQQDPAFSVIRMGPGPRLAQYMVKFSLFNSWSQRNATQVTEDEERFSVGMCVPRFCSDEVLCRNNPHLQQVLDGVEQIVEESDSTLPAMPVVVTDVAKLRNVTQTTPQVLPKNPVKLPTTGEHAAASRNRTVLSRAQHIMIISSVLSVIGLALITLCVVVGLLRKGSEGCEQKRSRLPRRHRTNPIRGLPGTALINGKNEEARLEMLGKALADQEERHCETPAPNPTHTSLSLSPDETVTQ